MLLSRLWIKYTSYTYIRSGQVWTPKNMTLNLAYFVICHVQASSSPALHLSFYYLVIQFYSVELGFWLSNTIERESLLRANRWSKTWVTQTKHWKASVSIQKHKPMIFLGHRKQSWYTQKCHIYWSQSWPLLNVHILSATLKISKIYLLIGSNFHCLVFTSLQCSSYLTWINLIQCRRNVKYILLTKWNVCGLIKILGFRYADCWVDIFSYIFILDQSTE